MYQVGVCISPIRSLDTTGDKAAGVFPSSQLTTDRVKATTTKVKIYIRKLTEEHELNVKLKSYQMQQQQE